MGENRTVVGRRPAAKGEGSLVIMDFETEMMKCKCEDGIESNPFNVRDNKFILKVFPNGTGGYVGVVLKNKQEEVVEIERLRLIVGADLMEMGEFKMEHNQSSGRRKWFTREGVKAVLKDGSFEVKAEVTLQGERVVIGDTTDMTLKKTDCQSKLVLKNMHKDMAGTDFLLVCEGSALPAHRLVLAAASPYFKAMMEPETAEAKVGKTELQCSEELGSSFVKFLYTGEIEDVVLDEHIEKFLCLGDMYLVQELKRTAETRMIRQLSRQNMVSFFIAGDRHHGAEVREQARRLLLANLGWLRQQDGWKDAFGDSIDLLIEILE